VAGLVVEGALEGALAEGGVELEVEQVAQEQEQEGVPERVVAAGLELALVQPQGQVLGRAREPQSVLDLMHP
jgi:hypothetical protein